jgi:hypothetical protein
LRHSPLTGWLTRPSISNTHHHSARLGLKEYDAVLREIKEGEATPTRTSLSF